MKPDVAGSSLPPFRYHPSCSPRGLAWPASHYASSSTNLQNRLAKYTHTYIKESRAQLRRHGDEPDLQNYTKLPREQLLSELVTLAGLAGDAVWQHFNAMGAVELKADQ